MDIRPFLEEIVNRTGSQRKAAAELGIGRTQLRIWIGASPHYRSDGSSYMSRYIHRDSAAHILRTLRRLRSDGTFYDHRGKPGSKPGWLKVNDSEAERKRIARRING